MKKKNEYVINLDHLIQIRQSKQSQLQRCMQFEFLKMLISISTDVLLDLLPQSHRSMWIKLEKI